MAQMKDEINVREDQRKKVSKISVHLSKEMPEQNSALKPKPRVKRDVHEAVLNYSNANATVF